MFSGLQGRCVVVRCFGWAVWRRHASAAGNFLLSSPLARPGCLSRGVRPIEEPVRRRASAPCRVRRLPRSEAMAHLLLRPPQHVPPQRHRKTKGRGVHPTGKGLLLRHGQGSEQNRLRTTLYRQPQMETRMSSEPTLNFHLLSLAY